jgi:hypothetical protein
VAMACLPGVRARADETASRRMRLRPPHRPSSNQPRPPRLCPGLVAPALTLPCQAQRGGRRRSFHLISGASGTGVRWPLVCALPWGGSAAGRACRGLLGLRWLAAVWGWPLGVGVFGLVWRGVFGAVSWLEGRVVRRPDRDGRRWASRLR